MKQHHRMRRSASVIRIEEEREPIATRPRSRSTDAQLGALTASRGAAIGPDAVIALQRTLGNQVVTSALRSSPGTESTATAPVQRMPAEDGAPEPQPAHDAVAVPRPGKTFSDDELLAFDRAMTLALRKLERAIVATVAAQKSLTRTGALPHDYWRLLRACFQVPEDMPQDDLLMCMEILDDGLCRIRKGLRTPGLPIVATNPTGGGGAKATGYVAMAYLEKFRPKDPVRPAVFDGRIHIKPSLLDPENPRKAAYVIVHEASHKFLGTRDWAYTPSENSLVAMEDELADMGKDPRNRRGEKKMSKDWYDLSVVQALNNADSFASFAMQASPDEEA